VLIDIYQPYGSLEAAISGTEAPKEITDQLALVEVDFLSFDGVRKLGELVIASELAGEIQEIFGILLFKKFPIGSVIPMKFFNWNDHASMSHGRVEDEAVPGNTSAFNYRLVPGEDVLSAHGPGRAADLNPDLNPYNYPPWVPVEEHYNYAPRDIERPGTIVEGGVVTRAFDAYGWEWGGRWPHPDYQHFQKLAGTVSEMYICRQTI